MFIKLDDFIADMEKEEREDIDRKVKELKTEIEKMKKLFLKKTKT